jgi:hypothetical protein
LENLHIITDTGNPEKTGTLVKKVLDFVSCHIPLIQEVQQNTRIDGPAAPTHHQAIKRGKAHAGGDALAPLHGAHAGAIAEMGDNHPSFGAIAKKSGQRAGDVRV